MSLARGLKRQLAAGNRYAFKYVRLALALLCTIEFLYAQVLRVGSEQLVFKTKLEFKIRLCLTAEIRLKPIVMLD